MSDDGFTTCHWERTEDSKDGNTHMSCCGQVPIGFKHHRIKSILSERMQLRTQLAERNAEIAELSENYIRLSESVNERNTEIERLKAGLEDKKTRTRINAHQLVHAQNEIAELRAEIERE